MFCQKINLKGIDRSNIDNIVKCLANQLINDYKEKDVVTYYDNIFRLNMINEKYDLSLIQLDSVRNVYRTSNPVVAATMGSQFEIYINSLKRVNDNNTFDKIYEEEFRKKYEKLSVKSKIILPQYFDVNTEAIGREIRDILSKKVNHNSIEITDAIQLCRKYNTRNVAERSFTQAKRILEKLEKETFLVYDSIKIKTQDQGVVSLTVVLDNKNRNPRSTILINTIYSDTSNILEAKEYAAEGYACVILNARGKYLSNSNIEPFEHEANDINDAIAWIVEQPWSNGKVGMIGGSYLGFSQWAATKKLHPALKTIIPQVAVGIGVDYPMQNNIFMSYMLQWLDYVTSNATTNQASFSDRRKWMKIYRDWYISGRPFNQLDAISGKKDAIFQRWLQHPSYDSYWQNMAPVKEDFAKINIPVLTTTGYFDDDQIGALSYYNNHVKYNKQADHYLVIGPYDHGGGQGYIKSTLSGLTIDPEANINLKEICFQWFDYILAGKEKPAFLKDKINYEVIGKNTWKSASSMDTFDAYKRKYYLNEDMKLSPARNKSGNFSLLKVDLKDRSDADRILKYNYDIVTDSLLATNNYLSYISDPFNEETEITGAFSGTLSFAVNKKDCDISMNLYEVLPDGKYFLLSKYIGRASYAADPSNRQLLVPHQRTTLPVKNTTFISKKIEKGSRLMLELGINKNPSWEINYGTGKEVSKESIDDAKEPLEIKWYNGSFIEIPFSKE